MSFQYKNSFKYAKTLIKWVFFAVLIGILGGIIGSSFHYMIDFVTDLRNLNFWIIFLLPLGGLIIAILYNIFKSKGSLDTNRVLVSIQKEKDVPFIMLPLIFVCSIITHLVGGSAGREGAALQLGGSLGYNTAKVFKLNDKELHIMTMAGMSSVFSALFGTPFAATIFVVELAYMSSKYLIALIPCLVAALFGYYISLILGIDPVRFNVFNINIYSFDVFWKTIIISSLCGLLAFLFCFTIRKTEQLSKNTVKNAYIRGLIGGILILCLTFIVGSQTYNGAGMSVIEEAMQGKANYEDFILKIIFTAITISAGFKGGEIVPAFFTGATFGCVLGNLFGLSPGLGALIGFVSIFSGITKCPLASIILGIEVFGINGAIMYIIISTFSYSLSGKKSIYKGKEQINFNKKRLL